MCIIIDNNTAGKIPADNLERALKANPDGCGVAFVRSGRVYIGKSTKDKEIRQLVRTYNTPGAVFHFRIKTHGDIKKDNCHPFVVLSKGAGDPFDLVMFHNGILRFTDDLRDSKETRTDSEIFTAEYLRPVLTAKPDLIYDKYFQNWLSHTAKGSKLVFLTSKNEHIIINKDAGELDGGIWYSNSSAFEPKNIYSTYYTHSGFYSNYNAYKELLTEYCKDMEERCPADNRGQVRLCRYTEGTDTDPRLNNRPIYTGKNPAKYNLYLNAPTIKTEKGLYFFNYDSDSWVEILFKSIDGFIDFLEEEKQKAYANIWR